MCQKYKQKNTWNLLEHAVESKSGAVHIKSRNYCCRFSLICVNGCEVNFPHLTFRISLFSPTVTPPFTCAAVLIRPHSCLRPHSRYRPIVFAVEKLNGNQLFHPKKIHPERVTFVLFTLHTHKLENCWSLIETDTYYIHLKKLIIRNRCTHTQSVTFMLFVIFLNAQKFHRESEKN